MKFSFIKNRKIFFGITIVMLIAGIVSLFTLGLNWDIEFIGGTEMTYNIGKTVDAQAEADIKAMVIDVIGKDNFSSLRIVGDNKDTVTIRTKIVTDNTDVTVLASSVDAAVLGLYPTATVTASDDASKTYTLPTPEVAEGTEETAEASETFDQSKTNDAVKDLADNVNVTVNGDGTMTVTFENDSAISKYREEITNKMTELYPDSQWQSTDTVSAEVSSSLKSSAITAIAAAIVLMLIYIAIRFEVSSAFAAVLCLTHDVLIMIFAYSLFQIPVGSTVIATVLTIVGYSINATIIIFDRIRENNKQMPSSVPFKDKVDAGIKSTLWRSLNTTITTLLTIGVIYFMGVTSIKNFALPLIVGILAGAYSSICLSGCFWELFRGKGKRKGK